MKGEVKRRTGKVFMAFYNLLNKMAGEKERLFLRPFMYATIEFFIVF